MTSWLSDPSIKPSPFQWSPAPTPASYMTSLQELHALRAYARTAYTRVGKIVDLGCWFGATASALLRGLLENTTTGYYSTIDAYDIFIWQEWMDRSPASSRLVKKYNIGQSFYNDVVQTFSEYSNTVRVLNHDLIKPTGDTTPVEFLFIDAMKNWKLASSIVANFFTRLIPGVSYVVQQDFGWLGEIVATNHMTMWLFRDSLIPVGPIPGSTSMVYKCVKEISKTPEIVADSFSDAVIDEAYEYNRNCIPNTFHTNLDCTKLLYLLSLQRKEAALRQFEFIKSSDLNVSKICRQLVRSSIGWTLEKAVKGSDTSWAGEIRSWFEGQLV